MQVTAPNLGGLRPKLRRRMRNDAFHLILGHLKRSLGFYWGFIGIMEKKMETTGTIGWLYRDYRVYIRVNNSIPTQRLAVGTCPRYDCPCQTVHCSFRQAPCLPRRKGTGPTAVGSSSGVHRFPVGAEETTYAI